MVQAEKEKLAKEEEEIKQLEEEARLKAEKLAREKVAKAEEENQVVEVQPEECAGQKWGLKTPRASISLASPFATSAKAKSFGSLASSASRDLQLT